MNNNILLSFLELSNSEFEFPIFRKSPDNNSKLDEMYRYKLPTSTRTDWDTYDVSFREIDETARFTAKSTDNLNMTKKWLMSILSEKATSTFSKSEFYVGNHFVPNISFVISSHKEGQCLIQLEPYYLEINNSFGFLVDYKFKPFHDYEKTRQEKILSLSLSSDGSKNKNYYSDKLRYLKSFIDNFVPRLFPLKINGLTLDIKRTLLELSPFQLSEKTYMFQNGESKIQFQGIKKYKPLNNSIGLPHYVFVFEKSKINISRQLVKALRGQLYPTFSGMENMFGVDFSNDKIDSIVVEDYSIDNLKKISAQLDEIIKKNPDANIVGIFAGIEKDFDTGRDYSPYYTVKSCFLERGLAIQAITIEQALKRDGFKWSISGIALQLFVKLGGVPWTVKPQNKNCLIFGVSSAHIKDEENNTTKYFAYSLCFDSSGLYKRLNVLGQSTDKDSYIKQLSNEIKKHLHNDLDDSIEKCVIHVPYKLKRDEMKCIKESIESVKQEHQKITFSVIKINVINKFFGYSHYNSNIPLAGSCLQLGKREYLVWFEGLQQGKTHVVSAQNISNPVHIQFIYGPEMTEEEIKTYLQDIINLSGANWRGFNAKHEPVSTLYPELIAKFAGKFDQYGLNLKIGNSAIKKVWFI